MNAFLGWLRAHPMAGHLLLKLGVALPLGGAAGLALLGLGGIFGFDRNVAAIGAAAATLWGSMRLAPMLARRLGITES